MALIPTARTFMTAHVLTVQPHVTVEDAQQKMLTHGFSALPVTDSMGHLVGMYEEQDCLRDLCATVFHGDTPHLVASRMRRTVTTIDEHTDLHEVVRLMRSGVRRLPVLSGERLIGLVTRTDAVRALRSLGSVRQGRRNYPTVDGAVQ